MLEYFLLLCNNDICSNSSLRKTHKKAFLNGIKITTLIIKYLEHLTIFRI